MAGVFGAAQTLMAFLQGPDLSGLPVGDPKFNYKHTGAGRIVPAMMIRNVIPI